MASFFKRGGAEYSESPASNDVLEEIQKLYHLMYWAGNRIQDMECRQKQQDLVMTRMLESFQNRLTSCLTQQIEDTISQALQGHSLHLLAEQNLAEQNGKFQTEQNGKISYEPDMAWKGPERKPLDMNLLDDIKYTEPDHSSVPVTQAPVTSSLFPPVPVAQAPVTQALGNHKEEEAMQEQSPVDAGATAVSVPTSSDASPLEPRLQSDFSEAKSSVDPNVGKTMPVGIDEQAPQAFDEPPRNLQKSPSMARQNTMSFASGDDSYLVHTAHFQILEAKDLIAADSHMGKGTSDPYLKIVDPEHGELFRTRTIKKTVNPVWNESYKFELSTLDPKESKVALEIFDEDKLDSDDLLGRVTLEISDLIDAGGTMQGWFDILPDEDCPNAQGQLLLKAALKTSEATDETAYFRIRRWGIDDEVEQIDKEEEKTEQSHMAVVIWFQWLVHSKRFDSFFCGCISLNAVSMALELEYNGRKSMAEIGLDEPGSNESPALELIFVVLNTFFTIVFVIELICHIVAFGHHWLRKVSSWLDIVIVGGSVLDVLGTATPVNLTFLRLIRLTRLTRLLKVVMMSSFCEPLRILLKTIGTSMFPLFWSFVLLGLIELVAALFLTQVLADTIVDESRDLEIRTFIYLHYGTTSRTMLTMFQITMAPGAWAIVGRPIIEEVSGGFAWFFVLYIGGVTFATIRIITSLFLRQTLDIASHDEESMRVAKVKSQLRFSESIREVFVTAGASHAGHVSFDQFRKFLECELGEAWLSNLELNKKDAASIFNLAKDGDGLLSIDEFLCSVFRLTNTTKPIDFLVLQHEAKKNGKMLSNFQKQLRDLSLVNYSQHEAWKSVGPTDRDLAELAVEPTVREEIGVSQEYGSFTSTVMPGSDEQERPSYETSMSKKDQVLRPLWSEL